MTVLLLLWVILLETLVRMVEYRQGINLQGLLELIFLFVVLLFVTKFRSIVVVIFDLSIEEATGGGSGSWSRVIISGEAISNSTTDGFTEELGFIVEFIKGGL